MLDLGLRLGVGLNVGFTGRFWRVTAGLKVGIRVRLGVNLGVGMGVYKVLRVGCGACGQSISNYLRLLICIYRVTTVIGSVQLKPVTNGNPFSNYTDIKERFSSKV